MISDIVSKNQIYYVLNEQGREIAHNWTSSIGELLGFTGKFIVCRKNQMIYVYTEQLKEGKITLPEIQRSIAGWLGYVKHADSYNLRKSMFNIEG